MITVKGKIENGKVLTPGPIDDKFEGREVTILFEDRINGTDNENGTDNKHVHWQYMMDALRESITDETTDLAHQHDHYLYGTPKRED